MDSDKNQTQLSQTASEQTSSKPDNDKPDARNQADGKTNDHRPPGNYAQLMSVAKLNLKNRRSGAELQRRRATIWRELEETGKILADIRSRLEAAPPGFDEDDLAEYRAILEDRERDLGAKLTLSEVEEDEDQQCEDLISEGWEDDDYEDDEDGGASFQLEPLLESLHEDSGSSSDDMKPNKVVHSDLDADSDEDSDSDAGANLVKVEGINPDPSLNGECF
ncbi:hypothetical protein Neosp_010000 [[Neocosmospora] mangrovei]